MLAAMETLSSLSGGNQQKVVIAREAEGRPVLLLAAQIDDGHVAGIGEILERGLIGLTSRRDAGQRIGPVHELRLLGIGARERKQCKQRDQTPRDNRHDRSPDSPGGACRICAAACDGTYSSGSPRPAPH